MDHLDPKFDEWLNEHEAEATRVKRLSDWRERQASELLLNVRHVRIFSGRNPDTWFCGALLEITRN